MVAGQGKAFQQTACLGMVWEIVSEQKIAAREGSLVQLEVKWDKQRTNQKERETCKDTGVPGDI